MGSPQLFDPEELEAEEKAKLDQQEEQGEIEQAQPEDYQDSTQGESAENVQPETEQEEPEIPEKYRGKSPAELVRMHQELEKTLGRQGGEVGELRKIVDTYIQSQTVAPKTQQPLVQSQDSSDDEEIDFYTDPDAAVRKAIEKHPAIQQASQVNQEFRRGAALSALQQKHPDMHQIVQDPQFAKWIESKEGLTEMFVRADQQYDFQAADTLFSLWKERANTAQTAATLEKQARKQAAKQANTGNVSSQPEGASRKRVFRRADIINLMNTDPDRYTAMQDEIMAAYAEGRVK